MSKAQKISNIISMHHTSFAVKYGRLPRIINGSTGGSIAAYKTIMSSTISSPTEIVDFVVRKGHGVKGLAETGLETVPGPYVLPTEERLGQSKVVTEESIPIIDFTNWDDPHVAESIIDAASTWGFFQVVNHGIPLKVLEELKGAVHRFFELPVEEKKKYLTETIPTKTAAKYGTSFSAHSESCLEWRDFLNLMYVSDEVANKFWPPECKDQVLEYLKAARVFIERISKVLLDKLNVKEIDEMTESMAMGLVVLHLNFYPPCPNPELANGSGRHSDASFITILLQDNIGGLYVRSVVDGENWVHVPPIDGALVINIGDMLQIMSNGLYKSIEHRVVVNGSQKRISAALFLSPSHKGVVDPLPQVIESGEKAKYRTLVYGEYLKYFLTKPLDGKKTVEYFEI